MLFSFLATLITIFATTSITINKILTDKKLKSNSFSKTVLKITILLLNILNTLSLVSVVILLYANINYIEEIYIYNNKIIATEISNSISILTVVFTGILLFFKDKAYLYLNNKCEDKSTNICDYCAFNELIIEKNTIEEDEILQLIKENPEKIEYVKKILK